MPTELERQWVARAHQIVSDLDHLSLTADAGGSPDVAELDGPDLRWPGYLGSQYGEGLKVLGVANVHRGFRSHRFSPTHSLFTPAHREAVSAAVGATRDLKEIAGNLTDNDIDVYLNRIRPMYEVGMSDGWRVAGAFAPAWEATGLDRTRDGMRRIAYVNTSCCQIPEDKKLLRSVEVKRRIKGLCTSRHPLAGSDPATDVIAMIRPDVIVCSAVDAWQHLLELGVTQKVLTIPFQQQVGSHPLTREVKFNGLLIPAGTHMNQWSERVRTYLSSMIS